jgi:release factor glutamine methyltransferase
MVFLKVDDMKKKEFTASSFRYYDLEIMLHPEVYNPAEDTFLLLETLKINPNDSILEIGTGCGLIALACAMKGSKVICSDINPFAVQLTRQNIECNRRVLKGSLEVRQGNLFSVLSKNERFNLIIFNPPYLPTSRKERDDNWFDIATNGGTDGLKIIRRFIHGLRNHLLDKGRAYFIFSSLSNRSTLEQYLTKEGFRFEILGRQLYEGEELDIYCIVPVD